MKRDGRVIHWRWHSASWWLALYKKMDQEDAANPPVKVKGKQ